MRVRVSTVVGLLLACTPAAAQSREAPAPGAGTLDAVVHELRLLRQALEKQNLATVRAQLLIGRLALQDQRTARARQAVETLENELTNAEGEGKELAANVQELAQSLDRAPDAESRQQAEQQLRRIQTYLDNHHGRLTSTQVRLFKARENLEVETGRYDELDSWFRELDKQLQAGRW